MTMGRLTSEAEVTQGKPVLAHVAAAVSDAEPAR